MMFGWQCSDNRVTFIAILLGKSLWVFWQTLDTLKCHSIDHKYLKEWEEASYFGSEQPETLKIPEKGKIYCSLNKRKN